MKTVIVTFVYNSSEESGEKEKETADTTPVATAPDLGDSVPEVLYSDSCHSCRWKTALSSVQ